MIKIGLASTCDMYKSDTKNVSGFIELAEKNGCEVVASEEEFFELREAAEIAKAFKECDLVVVMVKGFTWFGECINEYTKSGIPVCCWAVPEPQKEGVLLFNSMTGLNLFTSVANAGYEIPAVKWLYGNAEDEMFRNRFLTTLGAIRSIRAIKGKKIAIAGGVAEGFVNLQYDKEKLENRFEVAIEEVDIDELIDSVLDMEDEEVKELETEIKNGASCFDADTERFTKSCKLIAAVKKQFEKNDYAGMAIACWTRFQERLDIFPCMAYGYLCDHGYPIACEGDLPGLISIIMLSAATRNKAALMDMVQVDLEFNGVVWWHCGIGLPSYADEKGMKIKEYPSAPGGPSDPGIVGDLVFKSQPASIFRITDNGDRLFAMSANIGRQRDRGHDGVRAWFTDLSMGGEAVNVPDFLETFTKNALPHHYAMAGGKGEAILIEAGKMLGMQIIKKEQYHDYL